MALRRGPPRLAKSKRQKTSIQVAPDPHSIVNRFCYVLDLGSASVWDYLDAQSVSNTLKACPDIFSQDFIDSVSLKAAEKFVVEHKTHLGCQCECDWMRRLDFSYRYGDGCKKSAPFTVEKSLPILKVSGGPKILLDALLLTDRLMKPFKAAVRARDATFAPILCPLVTPDKPKLRFKAAVTRAMNVISPGAGSRFFYKFKLNPNPHFVDYIEEHWKGMHGVSCEYCDSLTDEDNPEAKKYTDLTSSEIERIRTNCTDLYRPLKVALERNLKFVRFVRRPRRRSRREWDLTGKYRGLVAGVTEGGVLCGLFLVSGFWPHA
ncbi:hypothetical protein P3T76_000759 [Phytophthora citrophthora]|uniref:Uncharacterized protein n=1 Tax=Phytophthora citrophthora TaxID=4793 RepID=A0AAD9LSN2_9STRA|nr:hypothetical protein P3T76_000759 [Phytophthora citrophthora]